jgi:glycerol kinase|tara:strand:- start:537 stop:2000 length:1464 start_codon:yes stop_codon:yes gene_type:complete
MKEKIISIDQGTSSTRSVLYDNKGRYIDSVQQEFDQLFPMEGWVEHSPDQIWDTVIATLTTLVKRNELTSSDIASIGITNQRETTIVWNKRTGQPIYNAIVWQDRRTASFCEGLISHDKEIQKKTGLTLDPYFSATKINWILNNVDGAKELAQKGDLLFGTIDTFLIWKMTEGRHHLTDVTNASRTMLFNIKQEKWDESLLDLFQVPISMLPEVCDNVYDFGVTKILGGDVSIGGVAGDQQAALIGQCCFSPGEVKSTYGTGCFMIVNTGEKPLFSENRLLTTIGYRLNGKTSYALEGSIFVAGSAIQWLRDGLDFFEDSSETEKLAQEASSDSKVLVVPALTGLGAPYWDAEARGAIFGLTRDTGKEEVTKATLESIAYQSRDLIEAMKKDNASLDKLMIDGGMVANNWFCQKLANTLTVEVTRPKIIETTSLGAAFLAGINAGLFEDIEMLRELKATERSFVPEEEVEDRYLEWKDAVTKVLTKS